MSQIAAAWPEIIERVLGEFHVVENATPDWLVEAESGRRFKVDRLYPELGIAIRFKGGLNIVPAGALDDIELVEELERDKARARLCRQAGIALVTIDANNDAPGRSLVEMRAALSTATRRLAQRQVAQEAKRSLLPRVSRAKATCQEISNTVSSIEDLLPFAQAWEDRQFGGKESAGAVNYQPGMAVKHAEYGKGLVLRVVPGGGGDDTEIVAQFSDGSMHSFLSSQANQELKVGD